MMDVLMLPLHGGPLMIGSLAWPGEQLPLHQNPIAPSHLLLPSISHPLPVFFYHFIPPLLLLLHFSPLFLPFSPSPPSLPFPPSPPFPSNISFFPLNFDPQRYSTVTRRDPIQPLLPFLLTSRILLCRAVNVFLSLCSTVVRSRSTLSLQVNV